MYIQRLGFSTAAPEIKRSLGLDDQQIETLMAALLAAYGIFQIPGGLLADRLGRRRVLTLTILVLTWSLVTGAVALVVLLPAVVALRYALFLVLRLLFGVFQAGSFPALGRVIADWMPVLQRGFAQGAIWMLSRFGGALIMVCVIPTPS
jgi:sugar phosphate permease